MGNCNGSKSQGMLVFLQSVGCIVALSVTCKDIDASRRRAPAADKNQAPQKTTTKPIGAPSAVPQPA